MSWWARGGSTDPATSCVSDGRPDAPARVDVLGVGVSAITMDDAVGRIERWIRDDAREYVCITTVHGIMESHRDLALREVMNRSGLTTPDGMPLVWLAHRAGHRRVTRVYGPDLLLRMAEVAAHRGYRFFFYGGAEGVPEELAARLTARFPGLDVVGCLSPPFHALSPEEDAEVVATINSTQPDIVWVGLSTPKQEQWMAGHLGRVEAKVMIGVGAAFDFHSGRKRQAPRWMQRSGLEWLFRLVQEPRRLGRRYVVYNTQFVYRIARRSLRRRDD